MTPAHAPGEDLDYLALLERSTAKVTFHGDVVSQIAAPELAQAAAQIAAGLRERGMIAGERIVIPGVGGADFLRAFLGTLAAGCVPCVVALPRGHASAHALQLRAACAAVSPACLLAWDDLLPGLGLRREDLADVGAGSSRIDLPLVPSSSPHHVQLTSGSTSHPKAAVLSRGAVASNLRALTTLSQVTSASRIITWLPVYHDMGLVNVLIALVNGADLHVMSPMAFVRRPLRWLGLLSQAAGTHTAAPPFALRMCLEQASRRGVPEDLDLSSVHQIYVGAEPIPARLLHDFSVEFSGCGLQEGALTPAYGMAENVLAVTVAQSAHEGQGRVRLWTPPGAPSPALVSCGAPIPGTEIQCPPQQDGSAGPILIRGSSLMSGYLGDEPCRPGEWMDTGDLGYLVDGELYVAGRAKEILIVNSRNYLPYDIEESIETCDGIAPGGACVFGGPGSQGEEQTVALVESARTDHATLIVAITRRVLSDHGLLLDHVRIVPKGKIPRTTSGKRQRAAARHEWLGNHGQ